MDKHLFNLRHLRAYLAIHRTGSITAASDHVHLSQPALTQALAGLEARFGTALFLRHSTGMTPTDAGHLLAPRVTRALKGLRDGCDAARQKARQPRETRLDLAITATQLRALDAVARQGSFSIAARALGVAQPTLYRAARDLESLAGFTLYEKTRAGIALTPAAAILNRAAKLSFAELRQAVDDLAHLTGDGTQTLRVGSLPLSRAILLPGAIVALTTEYPDMRIQVIDGPYDDLLLALREGDLDMMIGALRDPVPAEDVVQDVLFTDTLGVFCGAGHPLAQMRTSRVSDLAPYGWIVPRTGTPTRSVFDSFARTHSLATQSGLIEASSMSLIRGVLSNSTRLTMISTHQAAAEPQLVPVRLPHSALQDSGRPIGVTTRRGWISTQTQHRFADLLRRAASATPVGETPTSNI